MNFLVFQVQTVSIRGGKSFKRDHFLLNKDFLCKKQLRSQPKTQDLSRVFFGTVPEVGKQALGRGGFHDGKRKKGKCGEAPNLDVSENSGFSTQIIHFNKVFHYFHHPFWVFFPYF